MSEIEMERAYSVVGRLVVWGMGAILVDEIARLSPVLAEMVEDDRSVCEALTRDMVARRERDMAAVMERALCAVPPAVLVALMQYRQKKGEKND